MWSKESFSDRRARVLEHQRLMAAQDERKARAGSFEPDDGLRECKCQLRPGRCNCGIRGTSPRKAA